MDNNKKICDNCGHLNSISANVCESCGIKLQSGGVDNNIQQVNSQPTKTKEKVQKTYTKKKVEKTSNVNNTSGNSVNYWKFSTFVLLIIVFVLIYLNYSEKNTVTNDLDESSELPQGHIDLSGMQEIDNLEKIIANNPKDTTSLLKLAHLYHDSGISDKAIITYEKYLKFNDKNLDAIVDMGVCYFDLKNYAKAEEIFLSAYKVNKLHQIALLNLGVVNLVQGKTDLAKNWFNECIKVNPLSDISQRAKKILSDNNLN